MNRRELLKLFAASSITFASASPKPSFTQQSRTPHWPASDWRVFDLTTSVQVLNPTGRTLIWLPKPLSLPSPFQRTLAASIDCTGGKVRAYGPDAEGLGIVSAEFPSGVEPILNLRSRVATRDWHVDLLAPRKTRRDTPDDLKIYLQPSRYIPTDGIVRETSIQITRGATSDVEKARAIYEWIVENTYRDPKVRGCGRGDIRFMLESGDLGGKCADINSLYVGLARAAGLPARDAFGIRVAKSREGYRSLGTSSENVTKSQHCRAEVYLDAFGWIPVDPADVRKVILEEGPDKLSIHDERVRVVRARLFGSWEMNWIAYNFAPDVVLPGSHFAPIPFLMYPQAETANGRLDCLDPETFRYEISVREIQRA